MKPIKEYRLKKGMSQSDLASILGVERSTIAKWETGAADPKLRMIYKIAEALNCEVIDLLYHYR